MPKESVRLVRILWKQLCEHVACVLFKDFRKKVTGTLKKKVREKSRECHNHKPQPFPDPEEEETDKSKLAQTEQTYEKHYD